MLIKCSPFETFSKRRVQIGETKLRARHEACGYPGFRRCHLQPPNAGQYSSLFDSLSSDILLRRTQYCTALAS